MVDLKISTEGFKPLRISTVFEGKQWRLWAGYPCNCGWNSLIANIRLQRWVTHLKQECYSHLQYHKASFPCFTLRSHQVLSSINCRGLIFLCVFLSGWWTAVLLYHQHPGSTHSLSKRKRRWGNVYKREWGKSLKKIREVVTKGSLALHEVIAS